MEESGDAYAPFHRPGSDPRRLRLRRTQAFATGLLVLMIVVFAVANMTASRWPAMAYLRAFAEAAIVGACADWFAVTALFRRPLGLPIPHTAIVPRNKDRIGDSLGRFIVENFLNPSVVDVMLRRLELAAWGGDWLQSPRNARILAERIIAWGPALMKALPSGTLEELAGSAALAAARSVPAAPTASALLSTLWNEGRIQPLVERAAEVLGTYLQDHQDVILEKVQSQSWRWLPFWVDRAIARRITGGLVQLLVDVQDSGHPWRIKTAGAVEALIFKLAHDPDLHRRGEAFKLQVLDDPRLHDHAHKLWIELEGQLQSQWTNGAALQPRIEHLVQSLGRWMASDAATQRTLNVAARSLARQILLPHREEVGRFIAQVVRSWDTRSVVQRLELQLGPDLQFIRVNGTLVGGFVGLSIYLFDKLIRAV